MDLYLDLYVQRWFYGRSVVPHYENEAQKKQIKSLLNKFQVFHQALETANYDSMEQVWEHHGVTGKAEYISVLRAGTPRPTILRSRSV
ncbi:hypothetical protein HPB47_004980 [Ixodes persulcatus]|uniref:Uncharacterized protein n=1 Tax=Ixodes persulcatus TaxID=34615 RepID=A0AC60PFJ9_IXOPE|nr:hypothetical protein HPB47_004980 [Ixodes persulcatus]